EAPPKPALAAVPPENPDPDLQPSFVQPDLVAVPQKQLRAAVPADREADVVPENCAADCDRDDPPDLELVRRTGVERSADQGRPPRHRQADALDPDQQEYDEIAVRREPT